MLAPSGRDPVEDARAKKPASKNPAGRFPASVIMGNLAIDRLKYRTAPEAAQR
jgi:hypothetical protein